MSFAGTVAWMAPEVVRNEPCNEKVARKINWSEINLMYLLYTIGQLYNWATLQLGNFTIGKLYYWATLLLSKLLLGNFTIGQLCTKQHYNWTTLQLNNFTVLQFYDLAIFSGENLSIVYVRRRTASRDTRDDATTCFNSFVRAKDKEQNVKKVTLVLTERFPLQLLGHGAL